MIGPFLLGCAIAVPVVFVIGRLLDRRARQLIALAGARNVAAQNNVAAQKTAERIVERARIETLVSEAVDEVCREPEYSHPLFRAGHREPGDQVVELDAMIKLLRERGSRREARELERIRRAVITRSLEAIAAKSLAKK